MSTKTEAIKAFLISSTHKDLASLYNLNMECQVNVAQDGGTRIEGDYQGRQWHGWTDAIGLEVWKSFRIPFNAATEPSFNDSRMSFDLAKHVEGIGMTGWDWKNRLSRWVAFDFDAITGHSDKHSAALTPEQLNEVKDVASSIPWVTVRKSTSGKGLHLYVFLEPVTTANHNEHAALARAILGKMASVTSFNFAGRVDVSGGNMWCWHRKMINADGLTLIKDGLKLPADQVPVNWRDHVKVITGRKKRAIPKFIEESQVPESERLFEELCGQRASVLLDESHKRLIKRLEETGAQAWWDNDYNMLVAHTFDLKEAHQELNMRGLFDTEASGTEKGVDHNCFLFPLRRGSWAVRRFTPGVKEKATWDQDGVGWTTCYLNKEPDLSTSARAYEGIENEKGGYVFRHAEQAVTAAKELGAMVTLPNGLLTRPATLKEHKDGRLVFIMEHEQYDRPEEMLGWLNEKGQWKRIFNVQVSAPVEDTSSVSLDDTVRHVVTGNREDAGWVLKSDEKWSSEPLNHIKEALTSLGVNTKDVKQVIGNSVLKPWEITNLPFQPEYPGDRKWNRDSAQLRFNVKTDRENLRFPTWTKILTHLGKNLDTAIKINPWAVNNGIVSGSDYLKCWIASLFQEPMQPLPYLFFWGDQDSGKSIFHESLEILLTRGYMRADMALTSVNNFNGELENAIICVVEETDLGKNKIAYNRIKDWVTSPMLPIHHKGQTPYSVRNLTHWIQCANEYGFGPVFPGDTRITMIKVDGIDPLEMIAKKLLMPRLIEEASDFLTSVLSLELPPSNDRLNIPIITTMDKMTAARHNQTMLDSFLEERCHHVLGEKIRFGEFHDAFWEYLDPSDQQNWSKIKTGRSLPLHYPKGRIREDNYHYVGNISWKPFDPSINKNTKLIMDGVYLIHEPK